MQTKINFEHPKWPLAAILKKIYEIWVLIWNGENFKWKLIWGSHLKKKNWVDSKNTTDLVFTAFVNHEHAMLLQIKHTSEGHCVDV
jgi:hypothetical protein